MPLFPYIGNDKVKWFLCGLGVWLWIMCKKMCQRIWLWRYGTWVQGGAEFNRCNNWGGLCHVESPIQVVIILNLSGCVRDMLATHFGRKHEVYQWNSIPSIFVCLVHYYVNKFGQPETSTDVDHDCLCRCKGDTNWPCPSCDVNFNSFIQNKVLEIGGDNWYTHCMMNANQDLFKFTTSKKTLTNYYFVSLHNNSWLLAKQGCWSITKITFTIVF